MFHIYMAVTTFSYCLTVFKQPNPVQWFAQVYVNIRYSYLCIQLFCVLVFKGSKRIYIETKKNFINFSTLSLFFFSFFYLKSRSWISLSFDRFRWLSKRQSLFIYTFFSFIFSVLFDLELWFVMNFKEMCDFFVIGETFADGKDRNIYPFSSFFFW